MKTIKSDLANPPEKCFSVIALEDFTFGDTERYYIKTMWRVSRVFGSENMIQFNKFGGLAIISPLIMVAST